MTIPEQRLYWIWGAMIQRCHNPKSRQYSDYGGRGIAVCDRWRSFNNFYADMGLPPSGMLLDRTDNNLGYSPENCAWSSRIQQNSNRRNCIMVAVGGETVTLKEACRRAGIKYRPVHKRYMDRGWDIDRALNTPLRGAQCR